MRRLMLFIACALAWLPRMGEAAPTLVPPPNPQGRGLAVVVDQATFEACRPELDRYVRDLGRQGFAGWLLIDRWERPDAVREAVAALRQRSVVRLEGLFLVGDIPIAMARDAQHLTSAFKMDQERYPPLRSSVPTDRFYDALDLRWEYLEQEPSDPLVHYYRLATGSPVHLRRELYSGRLSPRGGTADERHAAIRGYFAKLAEAKRRSERLDRALVAMGHGYVSESTAALTAHVMELRDTLTYGAETTSRVDVIAQLYDNAVKPRLLQSWADPALDLVVIHCHGSSDTLLLDTQPRPRTTTTEAAAEPAQPAEESADKPWHLTSREVRRLVCGAEVVMLDACFNGSFVDEDYLAAAFLFGEPDTLVTIANSRNVRQDIWSQEALPLLRAGITAGEAHRRVRFLESHLFGDPTFAFQGTAASDQVVGAWQTKTAARLTSLARTAADPVARGLALERLVEVTGGRAEGAIRERLADPSPFVRLKALRSIVGLRPADLPGVLAARLGDSDPQVRKFSVILFGDQGEPRAAPLLANLATYDPCSRCRWQAGQALGYLGASHESAASQRAADLWQRLGYQDRSELFAAQAGRYLASPRADWAIQRLTDDDSAKRRLGARTLRGNRYREGLSSLLGRLAEETDPDVRADVAEALGWWSLDRRRPEILAALEATLVEPNLPPVVTRHATVARLRLLAGPNDPLVP